MSRVLDFPALDLMSLLRDQGGSAQLCSEGIQVTNVHTALLMYWGFDREVGNTCGDDRGKVGESRGR